jgi:gamma-tubulin complex component 3
MLAPSEGDRGWDVFSLDYKTSSPIDVMLGADAIASYLRVFGFLWQLKRVEHRLASAFLRQVTREHRREEAPALAGTLALGFHLRSEMLHFVRNLHNFIMFEVLEAAWTRFAEVLDAARDLDQVLDAHERYLREIVDKALMGAGAVSSPQMSSSDGSAPVVAAAAAASAAPLLQLLHQLFDMILKFCALQERIYDALAQEQERASAVAKCVRAPLSRARFFICARCCLPAVTHARPPSFAEAPRPTPKRASGASRAARRPSTRARASECRRRLRPILRRSWPQ